MLTSNISWQRLWSLISYLTICSRESFVQCITTDCLVPIEAAAVILGSWKVTNLQGLVPMTAEIQSFISDWTVKQIYYFTKIPSSSVIWDLKLNDLTPFQKRILIYFNHIVQPEIVGNPHTHRHHSIQQTIAYLTIICFAQWHILKSSLPISCVLGL